LIRKPLVAGLSALMIASLLVTACGKTATPTGDKNPTDTPKQPAVGGEMVYSAPADPDTFAPLWNVSAYGADITNKVYGDGLMRIGYDLKPEPALADGVPTISADQKTYTFKIKKGIKFSDGHDVTAEDFAFTYAILMDKDYDGPYGGTVDSVESVKVIDPYTIEFKTKDVFAPFLFSTASWYPIPKHIFGAVAVKDMKTSDLWKQPVGAGPWKFVDWKSGQYTLLERNTTFWETGKPGVKNGVNGPYLDKIRIKVIPESTTDMAALEAGELTYKGSVEPSFVDRLKTEQKDKLNAYDWNRLGFGYQQFNNEAFPTNIKEVRQALSYGLNRETIIKGVMDNKATIPPGLIPPIHWTFDKTLVGYNYDPKRAEDLIVKAGFKKNAQGIYEKDGKPLKLKYVATKGSALIEGIALQSQKDWKAIGIETEIDLVDFNTLLDKHLKPGDFNISFSGQPFGVDPHSSFDLYNSANIHLDAKGFNSGSNRARYRNAEVDKLINEGKTTVDVAKRLEIYQKAQRLIVDDAPANWIYVNLFTDFAKKDLKGVINWDGYGMSFSNQWYLMEK
jgi:peptide/nickel transport system substrate-binding protein